jgi:putative hydrolase of the HAD superfamily
VLFDIDGTLFDNRAAMLAAAQLTLGAEHADTGGPIWMADALGRYAAFLAGEMTFLEHRSQRIADLYTALGAPAPDVPEWIVRYERALLAATAPYDDVLPCLDACTGLRLGAVSNSDGGWQRTRLATFGLDRWIGPVVCVDDAGAAKPSPAIFHAGCAALGLDPSEVAYIGDELAVDAQGATTAGLRGIWLDRLGDGSVPVDVLRITTLTDLVPRLGDARMVR